MRIGSADPSNNPRRRSVGRATSAQRTSDGRLSGGDWGRLGVHWDLVDTARARPGVIWQIAATSYSRPTNGENFRNLTYRMFDIHSGK
jgi:hypothetical protein